MRIGSSRVSALYLGENLVPSAYIGSNLVYSNDPVVLDVAASITPTSGNPGTWFTVVFPEFSGEIDTQSVTFTLDGTDVTDQVHYGLFRSFGPVGSLVLTGTATGPSGTVVSSATATITANTNTGAVTYDGGSVTYDGGAVTYT